MRSASADLTISSLVPFLLSSLSLTVMHLNARYQEICRSASCRNLDKNSLQVTSSKRVMMFVPEYISTGRHSKKETITRAV